MVRAVPLTRWSRVALAAALLTLLGAAKCPGAKQAPSSRKQVTAVGDSAEQVVYGARMLIAEQSVAKGLLDARTARVYAGGTRMELQGVTFTFYDTAGVKAGVLSGDAGTYSVSAARLDVRGKATVVREDGRRLESEHIVYDHARSTLSADGAFVYSDAPGAPRVTGTGFESDTRLRRPTRRPAASARPR